MLRHWYGGELGTLYPSVFYIISFHFCCFFFLLRSSTLHPVHPFLMRAITPLTSENEMWSMHIICYFGNSKPLWSVFYCVFLGFNVFVRCWVYFYPDDRTNAHYGMMNFGSHFRPIFEQMWFHCRTRDFYVKKNDDWKYADKLQPRGVTIDSLLWVSRYVSLSFDDEWFRFYNM